MRWRRMRPARWARTVWPPWHPTLKFPPTRISFTVPSMSTRSDRAIRTLPDACPPTLEAAPVVSLGGDDRAHAGDCRRPLHDRLRCCEILAPGETGGGKGRRRRASARSWLSCKEALVRGVG